MRGAYIREATFASCKTWKNSHLRNFKSDVMVFMVRHRRRQGGTRGTSPSKLKKLLEKNGVISEGSIFSNNISQKSLKIHFFYWIFIKNFKNFLKISKKIVFFVQTREKLTHGLLNSLEYMLNNAFLAIFLGKFFKIFKRF